MDEELKQYLTAMEGRLDARLDEKLDEKLGDVETRLLTAFHNLASATEARLDAKLEGLETRLLTAFHNWASPTEARMRTHAAAMKAIDAEYEYLDARVKALEGRKAS